MKMSSSSRVSALITCAAPTASGGSPGSVRSSRSRAKRSSSSLTLSACARASISASICARASLAARPTFPRSASDSMRTSRSNSGRRALRPRKRTRSASSSELLAAPLIATSASLRMPSICSIIGPSRLCKGRPAPGLRTTRRPGAPLGSLARGCRDLSESLWVTDSHVRKHLAIELDPGLRQTVHKARVAHALPAGGGIDARDPKTPKVALAGTTVAVGVGVRPHQRLFGALVPGVRLTSIALGQRQRRTPLLAGVYRALDPHLTLPSPSSRRTRAPSLAEISAGPLSARLRLGGFFSRMWLVKAWRPRSLPVPVTLKRFFAPEWVFILGIAGEQYARAPPQAPGCRLLAGSRRIARNAPLAKSRTALTQR